MIAHLKRRRAAEEGEQRLVTRLSREDAAGGREDGRVRDERRSTEIRADAGPLDYGQEGDGRERVGEDGLRCQPRSSERERTEKSNLQVLTALLPAALMTEARTVSCVLSSQPMTVSDS